MIQGLTLPMAEQRRENMELLQPILNFRPSSTLSVAYQEMKCIAEYKMAASYGSELKRLTTAKTKLPNNTTNKDHSTLTFEESTKLHYRYPDLPLWSQQTFFLQSMRWNSDANWICYAFKQKSVSASCSHEPYKPMHFTEV